jgi:hypothetical protein
MSSNDSNDGGQVGDYTYGWNRDTGRRWWSSGSDNGHEVTKWNDSRGRWEHYRHTPEGSPAQGWWYDPSTGKEGKIGK